MTRCFSQTQWQGFPWIVGGASVGGRMAEAERKEVVER